MPLIPCPECLKEISDKAVACPQCGCPIAGHKSNLEHTLPSMRWDSEDETFICVKCPKCSKEAKIRKTTAQKTSTGYTLSGEGSCSCGLTFNTISQDILNPSHVVVINQPSRRSTSGLLSLLLGGLGVHHFYLGRPVAGIFNLLFCWTFIPAILAFFTAIQYFSMSDDVFNRTVDKLHPNFGR